MGGTALILAAQRDGRVDPLAAATATTHKCLVPVAGQAMILHVIDAISQTSGIDDIRISIDDPDALSTLPELVRLMASGRLRIVRAADNLADSVIDGLTDAAFPALVTTADNVLLTPEAISEMRGAMAGADAGAAFARRAAVLGAHPDGQRRFYRFSDDAYSNCNAYWIGSEHALRVAEVFRQGGQFAKKPARIIRAFGLINLVRFRFGIGTLDQAFARFSRRFGVTIRPLILNDGRIAIDVDNERTHAIAEQLLLDKRASLLRSAA